MLPFSCLPEAGLPDYTSGHWVHVVIASCDTHGVRWDCSVSRPPLGRARISSYYFKKRVFVVFQSILAANCLAVPFMSLALRGICIPLVLKQLLLASSYLPHGVSFSC